MENITNDINLRMKGLIDKRCLGNVSMAAKLMGLKESSKLNRLFNIGKNGKFPTPSTDILIKFSIAFECSIDWLVFGEQNKTVNNINIDVNKSINGNNNNNSGTINLTDMSISDLLKYFVKENG